MRTSLTVLAVGLASLALAACEPAGPKGVDSELLTQQVSKAIGDPNTCVLIVEKGSAQVVFRYGDYMTCALGRPACDGVGTLSTDDLAKLAAAGDMRTTSCDATGDAGRVGWASGPITRSADASGPDLAYAANMQGPSVLPGREIKIRLEGAFRKAGL
ncbi:MAG: hypothetical protein K9G59_12645 [Caulobacter sp.]|nr:hypothetical protein [Caulobacter sp.]